MDISDILYYIVIGGIAIFGYISQQRAKSKAEEMERRKREQAAAQEVEMIQGEDSRYEDDEADVIVEQPEASPVPSLEDIFKALRERSPLPEVKPRPVEPVVVEQPRQVVSMPSMLPSQEGMRVTAGDIASSAIDDKNIYNDAENSGASGVVKSIDWRQAVIATEILNRKY